MFAPTCSPWRPADRNGFLVPVKALAKLMRGKMTANLPKTPPPEVWDKPREVHCVPCVDGEPGILDTLARTVCCTASPTAASRPCTATP